MSSFAPAPGTPRSRLLALAVLGLIIAGITSALLPLWQDGLSRLKAERARLEALHGRHAEALAQDRRTPDEIARALNRLTLQASSPARAQAALQDHIKAILGEAGAQLDRLTPLPADGNGAAVVIRLGLRLRTDTAGLQQILHRIETGPPRLVVSTLSVDAAPSARAPGLLADLTIEVPLRQTGLETPSTPLRTDALFVEESFTP